MNGKFSPTCAHTHNKVGEEPSVTVCTLADILALTVSACGSGDGTGGEPEVARSVSGSIRFPESFLAGPGYDKVTFATTRQAIRREADAHWRVRAHGGRCSSAPGSSHLGNATH